MEVRFLASQSRSIIGFPLWVLIFWKIDQIIPFHVFLLLPIFFRFASLTSHALLEYFISSILYKCLNDSSCCTLSWHHQFSSDLRDFCLVRYSDSKSASLSTPVICFYLWVSIFLIDITKSGRFMFLLPIFSLLANKSLHALYPLTVS